MERKQDTSVSTINDAIMHSAAIARVDLEEKQHKAPATCKMEA